MSLPGSTVVRYRVLVVLTGVAAASAVGPPVAVLAGVVLGTSAAVAVAVVATLALPVGVVGAGRSLSPSRPESVGSGGTPVVLVGLPATYGVVAVAAGAADAMGSLVLPMGVGGAVGVPAAVGAVAVAGSLRADRARAESDRVVEWRARVADRPSWWVRALGAVGGVAVLVVGLLLAVRGSGVEVWAPVVGFGAVGTALVVRTGRRRTYAAVDAGLVHGTGLLPWSAVEGYAVTDAAVVIHRRGFRGDVRIDRGDLADEAAVLGALDRYVSARVDDRSVEGDDER